MSAAAARITGFWVTHVADLVAARGTAAAGSCLTCGTARNFDTSRRDIVLSPPSYECRRDPSAGLDGLVTAARMNTRWGSAVPGRLAQPSLMHGYEHRVDDVDSRVGGLQVPAGDRGVVDLVGAAHLRDPQLAAF